MAQAAEFQEFYAANKDWLRPYAIFSFLRDLFGTAQHWRWGALSRPTPQARLLSPLRACRKKLHAHLQCGQQALLHLEPVQLWCCCSPVQMLGEVPTGLLAG